MYGKSPWSLVWLVIFCAITTPVAGQTQQYTLVMAPGQTVRFRPTVPQRFNPRGTTVAVLSNQPPLEYVWLTNVLDIKGPRRTFENLPGETGQQDFLVWLAIEKQASGIIFDDETGGIKVEMDEAELDQLIATYMEEYLIDLYDWAPSYDYIPANNSWHADEGEIRVTDKVLIKGVPYAVEYEYTAPTVEPLIYPGQPPYYPLDPDHLILLSYRGADGKVLQTVGVKLDASGGTGQGIPMSYVGPYYGYPVPQLQPTSVGLCILASPMVPLATTSPAKTTARYTYARTSTGAGPRRDPWVGPAVGKPTQPPQYVGQTVNKERGPNQAPGYPKTVVTGRVDVEKVTWNIKAVNKLIFGITLGVPLKYKKIKADFGINGSLSPEGELGFYYSGQVTHDEREHIRVWWKDEWVAYRTSSGTLDWRLVQTTKTRQNGYERIYTPVWAATLMGWRPPNKGRWPWRNGDPYDPECIKWGEEYIYALPRAILH